MTQQGGVWSTRFSHRVGPKLRTEFEDARLLDKNQVGSVKQAVEALNRGSICCADGYCTVYSQSRSLYFFLWRDDQEDYVCATFRVQTADHARRHPAATGPETILCLMDGATPRASPW